MLAFQTRFMGSRLLVRAAAAASAMVACGSASAQLTTWVYDGSDLQYSVDTGEVRTWDSYGIDPNVGATPDYDGIKLFGTGVDDTVFDLTGADYIASDNHDPNLLEFVGNRLVMSGHGTIDGAAWSHPGDKIRTIFSFGFGFSGGTLDIYEIDTGFLLLDPNGDFVTGVGSGTSLGSFDPAGYGFGFAFEDRFGADITTATTVYWTVTIKYDWTGMAPADTLNFNIPPDSIHIQTMKYCPGDLNNDRVVDLGDLAQLLSDYGCAGSSCAGDINFDGHTDLGDLANLLSHYGDVCP